MSLVDHASCKMVCVSFCFYEDFTGMLKYFHRTINAWYVVFIAVGWGEGMANFSTKERINLWDGWSIKGRNVNPWGTMLLVYKISIFSMIPLEKTLLSCLYLVIEHKSSLIEISEGRCINCKHRLDKIKKDSTNLNQEMPAYFQLHANTDCSIDNISIAKHRKLTNANIKSFDKELSKHQFFRYNQAASRDLI